MPTAQEIRQRFKTLLAADEIVTAPGCGDPITARLVELAGLPAIHASGSVAHRTSGYADAGILTMTEMTGRVTAMADRVGIPIIADADTGFGGAVNVVRTVREYERAGAAAIDVRHLFFVFFPTRAFRLRLRRAGTLPMRVSRASTSSQACSADASKSPASTGSTCQLVSGVPNS